LLNSLLSSFFQKTTLPSGVRIVTELMPQVKSLSLGFWFNTGSRDEPDNLAGIAHFLEHMNFKGTVRRSPVVIAREIESRGGHLNAFTTKENTCYFARVADEHLTRAVDVLADLTLHSVYDPEETERERQVILEEIKSLEDTPDELVFEQFLGDVYPAHPLGRSVLGLRESLQKIDSPALKTYSQANYGNSSVVIAAAGNLDHQKLVRLIERRFQKESSSPPTISKDSSAALSSSRVWIPAGAGMTNHRPPTEMTNRQPPVGMTTRQPPEAIKLNDFRADRHTNTQQAHIAIGCRSLPYTDRRRFVQIVLMTLLGGGMSSRLFQHIREKQGLAYTISAFLEAYQDTGLFGVYAATDPERAEKTLTLIRKELQDLTRKSVSARELRMTKEQIKGSLLLGLESPNSRMNRLAKLELYLEQWVTIEEVVKLIESVTSVQIQELACDLFESQAIFTNVLWPN